MKYLVTKIEPGQLLYGICRLFRGFVGGSRERSSALVYNILKSFSGVVHSFLYPRSGEYRGHHSRNDEIK